MDAIVTRAHATDAKVPAYAGGKFPLSTYLGGARTPDAVRAPVIGQSCRNKFLIGCNCSRRILLFPAPGEMLLETFPRVDIATILCATRSKAETSAPDAWHASDTPPGACRRRAIGLCCKRICARRLGAQRYERDDSQAGDSSLRDLFDEDMLGDDLDAWLAESNLMRRSFRVCAIISGLIESAAIQGQEKSGRQMTASSDLIYDVLRQHEPGHVLLKAAFRGCGDRV